MKKTILLSSAVMAALLFISCAHSVKRVDAKTRTDLSGYWNDTDLRLASEALIDRCMTSPALSRFSGARGRLPVIIVGPFRNASDEHIDTSILSDNLEAALINNGKARVVASGALREAIRAERADQYRGNTDEATMAKLGKEQGADLMLSGEVKTMVDSYGKNSTRNYYISARLTDLTSNDQLWIGQYNEIKKEITTPGVKP